MKKEIFVLTILLLIALLNSKAQVDTERDNTITDEPKEAKKHLKGDTIAKFSVKVIGENKTCMTLDELFNKENAVISKSRSENLNTTQFVFNTRKMPLDKVKQLLKEAGYKIETKEENETEGITLGIKCRAG